MAASLFTLLAIFVAGYVGASTWGGGNNRIWATTFVACSTAFILSCWLLGTLLKISPAKLMTGCGLAIAAIFTFAILFGKERK